MVNTTLGRTGLVVSRIGLGLAAPGAARVHQYRPRRRPRAGVRRRGDAGAAGSRCWIPPWAAGVRCFDAARSYGRGEEFLAGWLAARGVDPPTA